MARVAEARYMTAAGVGVGVVDRSQAIPELTGQARRLTFPLRVMGKPPTVISVGPFPVACGPRPGEVGGQGRKQGDA